MMKAQSKFTYTLKKHQEIRLFCILVVLTENEDT